MARSSDPKKLALWQSRFQCFLDSGLAVARFCAVEHVSESSFYYRQKKLGPQTLRRLARAKDHHARAEGHSTCAEYHGARAGYRGAGAERRGACSEDHGVFRPVTVVPAASGVFVRLPGGTQIEIGPAHLDAIRTVVAETVLIDQGRTADRNVGFDIIDVFTTLHQRFTCVRLSDPHLTRSSRAFCT